MTLTHDHPVILIDGVPRFYTFSDFRFWIITENIDVNTFCNWPFQHGIAERMKTRYEVYQYYVRIGSVNVWRLFPRFEVCLFNAALLADEKQEAKLMKAFPLLFNNLEP